MSYCAEISRLNPACFIFLVDQSGSMEDKMSGGRSKAQFVSDVLNRTLVNLITRCTKSDGVRNYFEIGVIGYRDTYVQNFFQGELSSSIIHPISKIEQSPLRIEDRIKKTDDGAGGIVEQTIKFPVWFEPLANGGTPMCQAIRVVAEELVKWCDAHPNSYPPTVVHVTDGESTDGDPEELGKQLCQIKTNDGNILLLTLHVSSASTEPVKFPSSEGVLPDMYSKMLFRMSSFLPAHLIRFAQEKGFQVSHESKGFIFNAEAPEIVDFFDIGTRASQLR